jgi:uncharacterized protein
VLPPDVEARLEAKLAVFEQETTHQIAVLTVLTLEGEPIESYALRVAETWKLGQKGLDNGLLLVVAPQDRRARVEVGYGLEGVVPDAVAKRVLEDAAIPYFRRNDYASGIEVGVDALMAAARGETIPIERRPAREGSPHEDPLSAVFFGAILALVFSAPFRRVRPLGALVGGTASGGLTWLLLASLGWAAVGFLLGALLGGIGPGMTGGGRRGRGWQGPVFVPGGGGFGGGGFGGGGFRGGGGGFGGGGASGSW